MSNSLKIKVLTVSLIVLMVITLGTICLAAEEQPMEEVFGLTELTIEGIKLNPEFKTDVYEYKVDLKEELEKLKITTLATDVNSNIEILGNENLKEGDHIKVYVVEYF